MVRSATTGHWSLGSHPGRLSLARFVELTATKALSGQLVRSTTNWNRPSTK
jgi:hypothetical protein